MVQSTRLCPARRYRRFRLFSISTIGITWATIFSPYRCGEKMTSSPTMLTRGPQLTRTTQVGWRGDDDLNCDVESVKTSNCLQHLTYLQDRSSGDAGLVSGRDLLLRRLAEQGTIDGPVFDIHRWRLEGVAMIVRLSAFTTSGIWSDFPERKRLHCFLYQCTESPPRYHRPGNDLLIRVAYSAGLPPITTPTRE